MKRQLLFLSAAAFMAAGVSAQQLRPGYVTPPSSSMFHKYLKDWVPGQELTTNYGDNGSTSDWEDEEFFVSRVALKPQFVNLNTQIDKTKPDADNKRLLFWVPINESTGVSGEWLNALPNAVFDSEVFSTWSYVTHYGNWTSPFGWVPGAMSDAAHKNGVLVSGVASIPWAASSGNFHTMMADLAKYSESDESVAKVGDFLRYHGVDGLGYNSEFGGGSSFLPGLRSLHGKLVKYMKQYQPAFENPWYCFTDDNGSYHDGSALSSSYYQTFGYADEPRTIMFLNYNWNTSGNMSTTNRGAEATGRDPRDIYLGQNMQSGFAYEGEYDTHLNNRYSIGLWGAHSVNYVWINRATNGSADAAKQATYQRDIERWFNNGVRNPAVKMPIRPGKSLAVSADFQGMSRYMEARSSLSWDLATEPFVSYFNVGNGAYYNWKGEQLRVGPWYNLGVQDYMPNWRWWIAKDYLGTNTTEDVSASITWDDAYMGGSCMRVNANNTDATYLHLFKTEFDAKNNTKLTIRYKVLKGTGDMTLVWSKLGSESTPAQGDYGMVFNKEGKISQKDKAVDGELDYDADWQYKTITMTSRNKLAGTISAIALKFENAKDLDVLIGEISLTSGSYATPAAPIVTRAKVLANNYKGIDGKVYYRMPNTKDVGEPVYNLDVKTSLFRLWSRTDADSEPKFLGTTTSWAGMIFSAPSVGASKVQFGVSAVSLDFGTESEITWSDEMSTGEYNYVEDVKVSKNPVTTNEDFYVEFLDPAHPAVDWEIKDEGGNVVASASNATRIDVSGLANTGSYDVVTEGTVVRKGVISVSDPGSGRQPIIETLTVGETDKTDADVVEIKTNEDLTLGYTGRNADGTGSRGVNLNELAFGVANKNLGIDTYKSFSVAFWLKVTTYPTGGPGSLLLIEDRNGGWPKNNWGFFWSRTTEGSFRNAWIDGGFAKGLDAAPNGMRLYSDYDGALGTAKWNHLVYVFEYNNENRIRTKFYLNGALQNISKWMWVNKGTREGAQGLSGTSGWDDLEKSWDVNVSGKGMNVTETAWSVDNFPITQTDWIKVGGNGPNSMAAINGVIDDFQVWGKAMDQNDVNLSKNGLGNLETLPDDVIAFWDFEDAAGADKGFMSRGQKQIPAYLIEYSSEDGEGQAGHKPVDADFSAGSPFVPGSAFDVVTSPSWTARKGILSEGKGNGEAGSVKLRYNNNRAGGDYIVTLTLANALGQDQKDYPVFRVSKGTDAIDGVGTNGEGVEAYTVGDGLFVEFAEDGDYNVEVYNAGGVLMAQKAQNMAAGQNMSIRLGAQGVYIVRVMRDGALARTIKVVRK